MARVSQACVAIVLAAAAGCSNPQDKPKPDVWNANFNVPFATMVACLAAPPTGAFTVYQPDYPSAGVARIVYMPANTPQARSEYVVTQMVGPVSQVSWRRFGNVGGYDWFDNQARQRAEACARNT